MLFRSRARAHLRYVQRDGTSRDGECGRLYSATEDRADGDAFLDRGKDDRHQFRFIVSPEDGAELSDLTAYTRDFMKQVEADLGTKLDWVAVNHYNTGHPHVHVIVNGRDDMGGDPLRLRAAKERQLNRRRKQLPRTDSQSPFPPNPRA